MTRPSSQESGPKREVIHTSKGVVYNGIPKMPIAEYRRILAERWGEDPMQWRVVCPSCGTVQSLQDFFDATSPETPEEKNRLASMAGFSCIGRVKGATGAFNRKKYKPCNYSSGGLFCINTLLVIEEDGKEVPAFEPAEAARVR